MFKVSKKTMLDCFKQKWARFSSWRKVLAILLILFLLFWASVASLFALPAITSVYFMTMIIKNVMDIHANWKWGSLFSCKRDNYCKVIGEAQDSEETFIKFPVIDPRTPQQKKQIRPVPAQPLSGDKKKVVAAHPANKNVIKAVSANKAVAGKPVLKGGDQKGEMRMFKARSLEGAEQAKIKGDKEDEKVFDMSSAQTEKLFDPSREDPSKMHIIKPESLVDDQKEAEKGKKVGLAGEKKESKAASVKNSQKQKAANNAKGVNKKVSKP